MSDGESNTFISATLDEYSIYRRHKVMTREYLQRNSRESPLANQLVSLNEISERSVDFLLVDGFICFGEHRRFIKGVAFEILSIGQYQAPETASVGQDIWIQSFQGSKRDVWYQLGKPSLEYEPYQKIFSWIADLAKHVIDYLSLYENIYLDHFRERFLIWLKKAHNGDKNFHEWVQMYTRHDFRHIVIAQANFLYCQAAQVDRRLTKQPLWSEIDSRALNAVPERIERNVSPALAVHVSTGKQTLIQRKTTVTAYVQNCFKDMPWAAFLHCGTPIPLTNIKAATEATPKEPLRRPIEIGDAVAIDSNGECLWKTKDKAYFGYVQGVKITARGRSLDLLWFYRPWDTSCKKMHYPFEKELFLSDHCNCGDTPIYERDIISIPRIAFFGSPESQGYDFFCRQQYLEGESEWRTLRSSNFRCQCRNAHVKQIYSKGDTVLVRKRTGGGHLVLKPAVVVENVSQESDERVKVRRLLSRKQDCNVDAAAPNELIYTDDYDSILSSTIERRCQIRFLTEEQAQIGQIPHPYNKSGSSDFYFITHRQSGNLPKLLSQPWPTSMKQGWLPTDTANLRRMRGLDIFCGGGNFGRGLEESGAVNFEWAVDYCNEAIHTYKANLRDSRGTRLFRGSVNDYLRQAMNGKGVGLVAQKGEVEVITAGNPCQGYSLLNPLRGAHDRGLLNESLVASALSFIDFYRPRYALLENVLGIARGPDDRNVLAQVLCVLVGIGYQVRPFIMDAWNFGSAQSRSRVIISCTAAGLEPLAEPPHTHSHPGWISGNSLGKAANGLAIGCRYRAPTSFEYITAEEATKDLPIVDGRLACIPFPDHVPSIKLSLLDTIRLQSVPRYPVAMSFMKAAERGYMPRPQLENFSWHSLVRGKMGSRCWQRIRKDGLMPTVTTAPRPSDGVAGDCVHWDQHRVVTIMEARRAQGYPDDEVIIGEKANQYKIVGNSVARPVAFALGMSLQKAWRATLEQAEWADILEPEISSSVMTPSVPIQESKPRYHGGEIVQNIPKNSVQIVIPRLKSFIDDTESSDTP